jgi:anaerobic ribonucleoside-triphosphate reductase activating protein
VRVGIDELAREILSVEKTCGVAFSGGEPFTQAAGLSRLAAILHAEGLSVVTFTGFPYDFLMGKARESWVRLLQETDLLIAGPFLPALRCNHPLLSSSNQTLHMLTDRITLPVAPERDETTVEFTISPDGTLCMTGFPDLDLGNRMKSLGTAGGN